MLAHPLLAPPPTNHLQNYRLGNGAVGHLLKLNELTALNLSQSRVTSQAVVALGCLPKLQVCSAGTVRQLLCTQCALLASRAVAALGCLQPLVCALALEPASALPTRAHCPALRRRWHCTKRASSRLQWTSCWQPTQTLRCKACRPPPSRRSSRCSCSLPPRLLASDGGYTRLSAVVAANVPNAV